MQVIETLLGAIVFASFVFVVGGLWIMSMLRLWGKVKW